MQTFKRMAAVFLGALLGVLLLMGQAGQAAAWSPGQSTVPSSADSFPAPPEASGPVAGGAGTPDIDQCEQHPGDPDDNRPVNRMLRGRHDTGSTVPYGVGAPAAVQSSAGKRTDGPEASLVRRAQGPAQGLPCPSGPTRSALLQVFRH